MTGHMTICVMAGNFRAYTFISLNTYNHPMKKKVLRLDLRLSSGVVLIFQVTFANVWDTSVLSQLGEGLVHARPWIRYVKVLHKLFFLIAETKHLAEAAEGRVCVGSLFEATVHCGREIMVAGAQGHWPYCICSQKAERGRS